MRHRAQTSSTPFFPVGLDGQQRAVVCDPLRMKKEENGWIEHGSSENGAQLRQDLSLFLPLVPLLSGLSGSCLRSRYEVLCQSCQSLRLQ